MMCDDCGAPDQLVALSVVAADLGHGAFLSVLCDVCWHRRQYRAQLQQRLKDRKATGRAADTMGRRKLT